MSVIPLVQLYVGGWLCKREESVSVVGGWCKESSFDSFACIIISMMHG